MYAGRHGREIARVIRISGPVLRKYAYAHAEALQLSRSCESTAFGAVFVSSCGNAGKHHRAAVEIIAEGASRRAPG
jgi:hypothetical protein